MAPHDLRPRPVPREREARSRSLRMLTRVRMWRDLPRRRRDAARELEERLAHCRGDGARVVHMERDADLLALLRGAARADSREADVRDELDARVRDRLEAQHVDGDVAARRGG